MYYKNSPIIKINNNKENINSRMRYNVRKMLVQRIQIVFVTDNIQNIE